MYECAPLKTWGELVQWETVYNISQWQKAVPPMAMRSRTKFREGEDQGPFPSTRFKTLFCHDMKGGYNDDRFIDGVRNLDEEPYHFSHWSFIDLFVYFSHHFVTIPTLGWLVAGRTHGVQVLGTIILEPQSHDLLCQVLDNVEKFVDFAVGICRELKFHGWLLNFEVKDLTPNQVTRLLFLTEQLSHRCPTVIWYDAVTIEGNLDWQNAVTSLNWDFFRVSHGIFLNYTWTSKTLEESLSFLASVKSEERSYEVYVGIDVFGRGCPGGGGFECDKALKLIEPFPFSVAFFAPAWTFELQTSEFPFMDRELRFWDKLRPFLDIRGLRVTLTEREPSFKTNFNPGAGRQEDVKWWINLRKQEPQPNFLCQKSCRLLDIGLQLERIEKIQRIPILFCEFTKLRTLPYEIRIGVRSQDDLNRFRDGTVQLCLDDHESFLPEEVDNRGLTVTYRTDLARFRVLSLILHKATQFLFILSLEVKA